MESLSLSAVKNDLTQLKEWLAKIMAGADVAPREVKQVLISADEIFSNIVNYAYPSSSAEKWVGITVDFDHATRIFKVSFSDCGRAFNPLERSSELPVDRIQQHIPGGLGLFLVHRFMDELEYHREGGRNTLTIAKKLPPEPEAQPTV